MTDVELAIRMTADATDAERAADGLGDSFKRMAADVESASKDADRAAGRLDNVASSAENLDDKGGKAAGALGALSAGAEVAGFPGLAAGMNTAAAAADGLSGVGQTLNLVMDLQVLKTAKAKAASIAHAAATKAQAAATKAMAVGQGVLNAVMSANPIGIVILAVIALIAVFVLLYKRSDRFRAIVQAIGAKAAEVFGRVIAVIQKVIGFVVGKLGPAFRVYAMLVQRYIAIVVAILRKVASILTGAVSGAFRAMKAVATASFNAVRNVVSGVINGVVSIVRGAQAKVNAAWQAIRSKAAEVFDAVRTKVRTVVSAIKVIAGEIQAKFASVWSGIRNAGETALDALLAPIRNIISLVESIIDKISKIRIPKIDLNPLNRAVAPGAGGRPAVFGGGGSIVVNVPVSGVVGDQDQVAAYVERILVRRLTALGL